MSVPKHSPQGGKSATLKGSWPLSSAVVCREGHISHISLPNHSFSGSKAKCSHPLGADPRRDILRT